MKHNEYEDITEEIIDTDLANTFHVYGEPKLGGPTNLTYNVNRTFNVIGTDNISLEIYEKRKVRKGETWTTISYDYYKDDRLWWLVCKMNNIKDPSVQPTENQEILLLRDDYVKQVLDEIKVR